MENKKQGRESKSRALDIIQK